MCDENNGKDDKYIQNKKTFLPLATRCQYHGGGYHEMNKFEQVPSDDNQMSITGGGGIPGLM